MYIYLNGRGRDLYPDISGRKHWSQLWPPGREPGMRGVGGRRLLFLFEQFVF